MENRENKAKCHECGKTGHFKKNCPMLKRETKAVCHGCGKSGHFKKKCPQLKTKIEEPIIPEPIISEPVSLTELLNETEIKNFLDKCFVKDKIDKDEFIIRFDGLNSIGRPNYLTFRFKPQYGNIRAINNCTNTWTRYGGYIISQHSSKEIGKDVLTKLNECKTVEDLILCFKTYPIFTELECNFNVLHWDDMAQELEQLDKIDYRLKKETKRDSDYSRYYTRIGDTNLNCWECMLSVENRDKIMSLYAKCKGVKTSDVKLMLNNNQTVKIVY